MRLLHLASPDIEAVADRLAMRTALVLNNPNPLFGPSNRNKESLGEQISLLVSLHLMRYMTSLVHDLRSMVN
jgi:hypothetical protein